MIQPFENVKVAAASSHVARYGSPPSGAKPKLPAYQRLYGQNVLAMEKLPYFGVFRYSCVYTGVTGGIKLMDTSV